MKQRCLTEWAAIFLAAALLLILAWIPGVSCDPPANPKPQVKPQYIAYYFFTSRRCATCKRIEQWSREAITQNFKDQIQAGALQWRGLNVDEDENKHFIEDFQLYTKSVIIAEYKDNKPVRWENLQDVWTLNRDREKYFDYIARETRSFMEKN